MLLNLLMEMVTPKGLLAMPVFTYSFVGFDQGSLVLH